MKLLRRVFGPKNSLILCYDHLTDDTREDFDAQIAEVGVHYEFSSVADIARPQKNTRALGRAAIVFVHARRSAFIRAIPNLLNKGFPFTLILHPGCIGLNRLPFFDEVSSYYERFPELTTVESMESVLKRGWLEPQSREPQLSHYRAKFGSLPLNELDSTLFFATWGQINELPRDAVEKGLFLESDPRNQSSLENDIAFVRQRCHLPLSIAYAARETSGAESILNAVGITTVITTSEGQVEKTTPRLRLPQFRFERANSDGQEEDQSKA